VVALGGWGIGQLVVAAQTPGAPPALPSQILALPSGGLAHTTTGPGPLSRSIPRKIFIPKIDLRAGIEREPLEGTCCVGVCGVYNLTAEDHADLADDALVVATSKAGNWTVVPPA
jgi:branched-chain amino acid transport system substrate-binding protein